MSDVNPEVSDCGSHFTPNARPDGSSPISSALLGTARSSSGTVASTSGEEEFHLCIGNPPLTIRVVTSFRRVAAFSIVSQGVYKSSTKISRSTTAAASGNRSLLSSAVRFGIYSCN